MEKVLSNGFCEMTQKEKMEIDGGMAPAAIYALGFICGTTPLAACIGLGLVAVGGVVYAVSKTTHN